MSTAVSLHHVPEINGMSPISRGAGLGEADTPKANTKQRAAQNETEISTKELMLLNCGVGEDS